MFNQTDIKAKQAITRHFSRAALYYDQHSFIQQEIGQRLLERCQWLKVKPQRILNIGSATGQFTNALQSLFPKAYIIGLDRAFSMCEVAAQKYLNPLFVCADMEILPFRSQSFDCIISNCTLEWSRALPLILFECKRILKKEGVLLFTTVGPDTLFELAHSTYKMDGQSHVNAFLDMHHVGDMLLQSGLEDPVIDKEVLTVTYSDIPALLQDIKKSGSDHLFQSLKVPFKKGVGLQQLIQQYEPFKRPQGYPVTIEIIYGYACKKTCKKLDKSIPTDIFIG